MMKRLAWMAAAVAVALGVGACGERAQVISYKQGEYQGKPDSQPWNNDQFKNDEVAWEKALKARNNGQNENVRLGAQ
jgi:hypothetical protein